MAGQFITQNRIVGFKAESTAGTYNAPTATDFDIEMFELSGVEFDYHYNRQGKPAKGNLTQAQSKSGMITATFSGKTRLQYTGDETVRPTQAKLWNVVGLSEAGGDGVSQAVYTYDGTAPCDTVSAIVSDLNCGSSPVYIDNKVRGIQAEMVINAPGIGQEITCDYTFSGAYEGEADGASPIKALQGLDTGASEKLLGTTFTVDGQAFIINSFTVEILSISASGILIESSDSSPVPNSTLPNESIPKSISRWLSKSTLRFNCEDRYLTIL